MLARSWIPQTVVLLVALVAPAAAQTSFRWETDLGQARQLAAQTDRLVLVHFGAEWCEPCQQLEQRVFQMPGFGEDLTPHFVAVKLDFDQHRATAEAYGVKNIPTDVILTPKGELVSRVNSPLDAVRYSAAMHQIAAAYAQHQQTLSARNAQPTPASVATTAMQPAWPMQQPNVTASVQPSAGPMPPDVPVVATPPSANAAYAAGVDPMRAPTVAAVSATAPVTAPGPMATPYSAWQQPAAESPDVAATPGTSPSSATPPEQAAVALPQIPPGNPPLGMEGCCTVTLAEQRRMVVGDARFGAIHRGRTYLFMGSAEQQKFLANPDRYCPVNSCNDPVIALETGRAVSGTIAHGVTYNGRVYLMANEQSRLRFEQNPARYTAEALQARRVTYSGAALPH
jgi:thiol-disulfide isomerase/thioredoxin/YHS domain-containing protein